MSSTVFEDKLTKQNLIDLLHPIGSIYMNVGNVNPSNLFEGTRWQQITDTFLVGAGNTYINSGGVFSKEYTPAGTVGNYTLREEEMPSHEHDLGQHLHDKGSYTIDQNTSTHIHTWYGYYSSGSGVTFWAARHASSGSHEGTSILSSGSHSHTVTGTTGYAKISGLVNEQISDVNTDSTGEGQSHNHDFIGSTISIDTLPPYLAVNVWKRIE